MRRFTILLIAVLFGSMAQAQVSPSVRALADAIGVPDMIDIMRIEGLASADELSESFLGGPNRSWKAAAAEIYDVGRMQDLVLNGMTDGLDGADPAAITAFFETELGVRIIGLELSARTAFLDEGVEEASNAYVDELRDSNPDRYAMIEDFIAVNDLVESNVIGALNSNYAFLTGLQTTGQFDTNVTERDILQQVWSQEGEIRSDTTDWLFAFLALAYQPLSDEDLAIYLDFSATRHGALLNKALFRGFDDMFVALSRDMGEKLGQLSGAEEL